MSSKAKISSESGFVSIIVTLIIMIVLTLIVIGFAQLARREQRSALDRQLSTQAFYAAESGVNDLVAATKSNPLFFKLNPVKTSCANPVLPSPPINPDLDASAGFKYTCVLYNMNPNELKYPAIATDKVQVIPIDNPNNLSRITFNWQGQGKNGAIPPFRPVNTVGPPAQFTPNSPAWNSDAGVLRVMIIPRANLTRFAYLNTALSAFLYPESSPGIAGPGTIDFAANVGVSKSGAVASGHCNAANTPAGCNVEVTNLSAYGTKGFFIVIHSIYSTSSLTVRGFDASNAQIPLTGAQISVDSTGQANDVLRRIEVRVPIGKAPESVLPLGIESMQSFCKYITLRPGVGSGVSDTAAPTCPSF